jgi:hypothetical protein
MIRLIGIVAISAALAGCVVAPPYGYGYDPGPVYQTAPGYYGYPPGYYPAPSINVGVGFGFGGGYYGGGHGDGHGGGHGGHGH